MKPGWQERSPFVAQEGKVTFRHFDLYAQALAKIERGHETDRADVAQLLSRQLVDRARLLEYFDAIESDPTGFRPSTRRRSDRPLRR